MTNATNKWRGKQMEKLRAARGNACQTCQVSGTEEPLEFAHIKPTRLSGRGRGRAKRITDIRRHPSHYKLMCHWCHYLHDHPEEI